MQNVKLTTAPTELAISLADVKRQLGVSNDRQDRYIETLIESASNHVTHCTGRALMQATYQLTADRWPESNVLFFPAVPLASITSVSYVDTSGVSTNYTTYQLVQCDQVQSYLVPAATKSDFPSTQADNVAAVTVTYTAGYSSRDDIPAEVRNLIFMVVRQQFDNPDGSLTAIQQRGLDLLRRACWVGDYPVSGGI